MLYKISFNVEYKFFQVKLVIFVLIINLSSVEINQDYLLDK